jgi:hypothetical protein
MRNVVCLFSYARIYFRYEQLQKEEKLQRDRADAAEKYKIQLENFIDMICHEIRNPYVKKKKT